MTERLAPRVGNLAALAGALGLIAGAIGPWATVSVLTFSRDIAGTEIDGRYTLALGIGAAVCALMSMADTDWLGWLLIGLGLTAAGVGIYDAFEVRGYVAWGLIVTVVSGMVVAIGGVSEAFALAHVERGSDSP